MPKRMIWAVLAVFITWAVLDFILHGLLLRSTYEATASLWRPMDQLNRPLMYAGTLVTSACFVLIYGLLVDRRSLASGVLFGVLFGLAAGTSMGFGAYLFMPLPLTLAWGWFLGIWIEVIAAGAIVGALMKS